MPKAKSQSRRLIITVGTIFVLAVIGLATLNTAPVTAQQSLGLHEKQTESNASSGTAGATAGQETKLGVGQSRVTTMSATSSILKMVSALIVVVICIYAAVFALKRFMGRKTSGRGTDGILEVLETAHLGPKKMLSVVRVGDRSVLVGVTDNQITLLSELDEAKTAEMVTVEELSTPQKTFGELLKAATGRIKELSSGKPRTALADK